jgi:hypothetical protein
LLGSLIVDRSCEAGLGGGSFSLFDGRDDDGSTVLDEMLR